MQTFNQTLIAAQSWKQGTPGNFFRLMVCNYPVDVILYRGTQAVYRASAVLAGFWSRPDAGFNGFEVICGATGQPVQVAIADGDAGYDRLAVSGTVTTSAAQLTTIVEAVPVAVGVAATALLAANAARNRAIFYNGGTVPVYLGSAGVTTANGPIVMSPGQAWIETEAAAAAWYGIASLAAQTVRVAEYS